MAPKKKRINFDDWYNMQVSAINKMSIAEVRQKRESFKNLLENIHGMIREEGITDKRRKYLIGRRKFVTRLLSYSKTRIKLFNVISHNGISQNLALRFVQIAAEELPQAVFQKVYGLTVMESEEKASSIRAIRDFIDEFQEKFTRKGM